MPHPLPPLESALSAMETHLGPRRNWPSTWGGTGSEDALPVEALSRDAADRDALATLDTVKFHGGER